MIRGARRCSPWVMRAQTASDANWRLQSLSSGWNGPFVRGSWLMMSCHAAGSMHQLLEGVSAVLVVDQAGGGAELPGERVHREAELCRVVGERC